MDFLEELFGPETAGDRLAELNLQHEVEWLARLVDIRKSKGLSQAEVGEAMGISQSGVARIEAGSRDLHLSSLRRYALAIGAEVRHLVNPAVPSVTLDLKPRPDQAVHGVPRTAAPKRFFTYPTAG